MRGHAGHGLEGARSSGGRGKSSKLVIDLAPCLSEVPMQSVPVSPPPMTTTFLPRTSMKEPSYWSVQSLLPVKGLRNEIASYTFSGQAMSGSKQT